jgi:hypothetical protein
MSTLHLGLSSSEIYSNEIGVSDKDGVLRIPAEFISIKEFVRALDLWKPWRPLLPGTLRTDSASPSPHISEDGFVLVLEAPYDPQVFIRDLEATGIPFSVDRPDGWGIYEVNEDKRPDYSSSKQFVDLCDGSTLHVPLIE